MAAEPDKVVLSPDEERDNPVLDEMLRMGLRKRDEVLGQDYFARLREWWNFRLGISASARTPTFRPNIMFSDLHWMSIQEAGDLTDNVPLPIISDSDGARREDHEKALRGQFYVGRYGLAFYRAALESLLCGTGVLMMVHDYSGRGGRGTTLLKCIETENYIVDPSATSPDSWDADNRQWQLYRSRMSIDEIRRTFGRAAKRLPRWPSPALAGVPKIGSQNAESPDQMRMPPGPMQQMSFGPIGSGAETRIVEYFLMLDDGRKPAKETDGNDTTALLPEPETVAAYPNGRLIIRCDKIKLFDGPQPYRHFNFIPVQTHPARYGFWAPPPVRYVIQLQEIAQTLSRQNVENAVRLNNGLVIINEAAGIQADTVLGLPGERIVIKSPDGVERAIKILTPPAFPSDLWQLPDRLLDKMKVQWGHDDTRRGKMPDGNSSASLYDAAMSAASGLTQVRARLMQPAVQMALQLVYETMLQYQNPVMFPLPNEQTGVTDFIQWSGAKPSEVTDWELLVDPASLKAMSSAVARQYALLLRNAGLLDVKSTLVALQWPDAERIAAKVEQDLQMQLLSKESSRGAPKRRAG